MMVKLSALLFFAVLVPVVLMCDSRFGSVQNTLQDVVHLVVWGMAVVVCPPHPQAAAMATTSHYETDNYKEDRWGQHFRHVCVHDHHDFEPHPVL